MGYTSVHVFGDSLVDAGNALKLANWYKTLTLSDLPDGAPTADKGYYLGRFTNGFTFTDLISNKYVGATSKAVFPYGYEDPWLDVLISPFAAKPTGPALNWAYGGAQIVRGSEAVSPLDGQTDAFRRYSGGNADQSGLYLVTIGGNDVRSLVPSSRDPATGTEATKVLTRAAQEFYQEIRQLIDMGVRDIVITGIPDVGVIPRYHSDDGGEAARRAAATAYSKELDGYIRQQVELLKSYGAALGVGITYVPLMDLRLSAAEFAELTPLQLQTLADYYGITVQALSTPLNPGETDPSKLVYGATGATAYNLALLSQQAGAPIDPDSIFFDQIHPNAQAHALLAASMLDSLNGKPAGDTLPLTAAQRDYSASGSISVRGEVDRVSIALAANTFYSFEMLGISSASSVDPMKASSILADPSIRLVNASGVQVAANDDGGMGLDANITGFYVSTGGTYTIELRGVGALTGSYTFQASIDSGSAMSLGNVYTVNSGSTLVLESAQGLGRDVVRASVSYTLPEQSHIEELRTTSDRGKTAINLTGNGFDQLIAGNLANNVLDGRGGNDTLKAGAGYDTLIGGSGNDTFLFAARLDGSIDTVRDFSAADDLIALSGAIFGLAAGVPIGGAFAVGSSATQADDRIIFDPATGKLYYDQDGSGSAQQVHFATLQGPDLNLSANDFLVVA